MTLKGDIAKEKIVKVTTQLIDREGDANSISIRRIAKLAGVSLSSINYYFRTKDELIEESVRIRVNRVMTKWLELETGIDADPLTKFRMYMHNLGEFIYRHSKVMKVSIINVVTHHEADDCMTYSNEKVVFPLLKAICPDKEDWQIKIVIEMLFNSIYMSLIRNINYPEHSAVDFFNDESRKNFINMLVDSMVLVLKSFDDK
jgi:AcrR family transcriptional regulator